VLRSANLPLIDGEAVVYLGAVDERAARELFAGAAAFLFPIVWPEPFDSSILS